MQYGNRVSDPVCGQCKKKLEMAVLTEAVYHDGIWWHTACHRVDTDQRLRATQLSKVLPAGKRGMELIHSPLFQDNNPPGWHAA